MNDKLKTTIKKMLLESYSAGFNGPLELAEIVVDEILEKYALEKEVDAEEVKKISLFKYV
jgi:hypothetical protein